MNREQKAQARTLERAMRFQQCPSCTLDFVTGEGDAACNYYSCPYLPDLLVVACPACNYNFATGEGRPHCGETPCCDFALEEAPAHVAALERWTRLHSPQAAG